MIVHAIHPDGRHKQLHGPRDLDSLVAALGGGVAG